MSDMVKPFHGGRPVYLRIGLVQYSNRSLNSWTTFVLMRKYILLLFHRERHAEPLTRARVVNGDWRARA